MSYALFIALFTQPSCSLLSINLAKSICSEFPWAKFAKDKIQTWASGCEARPLFLAAGKILMTIVT